MEKKLQLLSRIAGMLGERNVTWALGASGMLYLRGITDTFHDLDIMVAEEHIERAREAMAVFGEPQKREADPQYRTKHFLEYVADGVEVDVIAGFVIVSGGIAYPAPFDGSHIDGFAAVNGQRIPLQRLSDWARYYTLMGRPHKAALCRKDERMERAYFMKTTRIGFSVWRAEDHPLALSLWGDPAVTRYICASGIFSPEDIARRLELEIANDAQYGVQYWPIFSLASGDFIGCCGLRPRSEDQYEIGFHLRPGFWGQGYAAEAARAVIAHAFDALHARSLFAGHNPHNAGSRKVLLKLGFAYTGDEFYAPTGLMHPSYELRRRAEE